MTTKRTAPYLYLHIAVMAALAIVNLMHAFSLFRSGGDAVLTILIIAFLNLVLTVCAAVYLYRGYRKEAAPYYKAFMVVAMLSTVLHARLTLTHSGYGFGLALLFAKIIVLAILAFTEDMGKKTTWIIYGILAVVDLIYAVLFPPVHASGIFRVLPILSRLLVTASIGLAIGGKYADKEARGTD